jgi:hypothetical protein
MKPNALRREFQRANNEAAPISRAIDLYGRALDGRPLLWKRAVQVVPLTAFESCGRWIRRGHYVINHNGVAIVVHCGNGQDESVSVQFMHEALTPDPVPRSVIELMLLGRVGPRRATGPRPFRALGLTLSIHVPCSSLH